MVSEYVYKIAKFYDARRTGFAVASVVLAVGSICLAASMKHVARENQFTILCLLILIMVLLLCNVVAAYWSRFVLSKVVRSGQGKL